MPDSKITDLSAIVSVVDADVLPIVDISDDTTKKVTIAQIKATAPVQSVNGSTGAVSVQPTLVSGTNIKTINGESVLGAGNIEVSGSGGVSSVNTLDGALTLAAGSNVTITDNGTDTITIAATSGGSPSGVSGAIQFSDGSAFASDASNLFWDDTNKRLGVGTNAPSSQLTIKDPSSTDEFRFSAATNMGNISYIGGSFTLLASSVYNPSIVLNVSEGIIFSRSNSTEWARIQASSGNFGIGETSPTSRLHIKGSGSTSATTALLVQNSAGTTILSVKDGGADKQVTMNSAQIGSIELVGRNIATGGGNTITLGYNPLLIGGLIIDNSAILQADSTTKGFLPPRMTTTQKNAIATPASGLMVYDSTTNKLCCYNGSSWNDLF